MSEQDNDAPDQANIDVAQGIPNRCLQSEETAVPVSVEHP